MTKGMDHVRGWAPSSEMLRARAAVLAAFDVTEAELLSPSRIHRHVLARQAACLVLRRVWPEMSYPCIAVLVGRNDHSTVIHACRAMEQRMRASSALAAKIEALVVMLSGKPDLRDHNAHVRAWQRDRIARITEAARERAERRAQERAAMAHAAGHSALSNSYHAVVAAGVAAVSRARQVRPANELVDDDIDAVRRKVASDALGEAIAAAGGWRRASGSAAA